MRSFSLEKNARRKPCRNSDLFRKVGVPHPVLGGGVRGRESSGNFPISEILNFASKKSPHFLCRNSHKGRIFELFSRDSARKGYKDKGGRIGFLSRRRLDRLKNLSEFRRPSVKTAHPTLILGGGVRGRENSGNLSISENRNFTSTKPLSFVVGTPTKTPLQNLLH